MLTSQNQISITVWCSSTVRAALRIMAGAVDLYEESNTTLEVYHAKIRTTRLLSHKDKTSLIWRVAHVVYIIASSKNRQRLVFYSARVGASIMTHCDDFSDTDNQIWTTMESWGVHTPPLQRFLYSQKKRDKHRSTMTRMRWFVNFISPPQV